MLKKYKGVLVSTGLTLASALPAFADTTAPADPTIDFMGIVVRGMVYVTGAITAGLVFYGVKTGVIVGIQMFNKLRGR